MRQFPYVRGQRVDDRYLARVLELMLAILEGRDYARPLDVSGLGYVNLLHIAVTLAAIPDPESTGTDETPVAEESAPVQDAEPADEVAALDDADLARAVIEQAEAEAQSEEDSFFPGSAFHVTVVIEEPEAHLHPQLQHGLVRYLRRAVEERLELQVIVSSHAADVITACETEDLVVVRRDDDGNPVSRTVASIPFADRERVLTRTRLHLDATRSAALFSERVVLVEGITDAAVVRALAVRWAGDDVVRLAAVEALSIVAMGTRVGPWPVSFLATPGYELVRRLVVLTDSDVAPGEEFSPPAWMTQLDGSRVHIAVSEPTLEPAVTLGNERLVEQALSDIDIEVPETVDVATVHELFKSRRVRDRVVVQDAGPANARKADFALALANAVRRAAPDAVTVPQHIDAMLRFALDVSRE